MSLQSKEEDARRRIQRLRAAILTWDFTESDLTSLAVSASQLAKEVMTAEDAHVKARAAVAAAGGPSAVCSFNIGGLHSPVAWRGLTSPQFARTRALLGELCISEHRYRPVYKRPVMGLFSSVAACLDGLRALVGPELLGALEREAERVQRGLVSKPRDGHRYPGEPAQTEGLNSWVGPLDGPTSATSGRTGRACPVLSVVTTQHLTDGAAPKHRLSLTTPHPCRPLAPADILRPYCPVPRSTSDAEVEEVSSEPGGNAEAPVEEEVVVIGSDESDDGDHVVMLVAAPAGARLPPTRSKRLRAESCRSASPASPDHSVGRAGALAAESVANPRSSKRWCAQLAEAPRSLANAEQGGSPGSDELRSGEDSHDANDLSRVVRQHARPWDPLPASESSGCGSSSSDSCSRDSEGEG